VDDRSRQERLEAFEGICRSEGLPYTVQRRVIFEAILDLDDHPTADQVFESVASANPGISRTTVYRNLDTLVRLGAVARLSHPGRVVRYDRRTDLHHHLVCTRCNAVTDFCHEALDALRVPDTSDHGFEVSDYRVHLRGTCNRCREQEEDS